MLLGGEHPTQGASIVIIGGGGVAPEHHLASLFRRIIDLAGGPDAPIVVLTTATGNPERQAERTTSFFREVGANNLHAPLIRNRHEANDPANAALIQSARAIYLTGGDQSKYVRVLSGTASGAALEKALHGGVAVIGGTSAGAHVMGRVMIAGSYDGIMRKRGVVLVRSGFGLLSDRIVVDSHFSQRRRLPRMLNVVQTIPGLLGIGLDEDTGLVINQDGLGEVIGHGLVHFITKKRNRIQQYALSEGQLFDLLRRKPIESPDIAPPYTLPQGA